MSVDNTEAFNMLQGAIDAMAAVGRLPVDIAAAAVDPLRAELLGNIAAQRSPNGKAWPPGKQGQPVLVNAGKALKVTSNGPTLTAVLSGPEARHHLGIVNGHKRRQILPGRGSLGGVAQILQRIAKQKCAAVIS
jgi:hypothetical protein